MAQQIVRMTPPAELLLKVRKVARSTELLAAPRRRSLGFPETPRSARNQRLSPTCLRTEHQSTRTSILSSPTARGSPALRQSSASPRLSPNKSPLRGLSERLKPRSPKTFQCDRFIPNRSDMDFCRSNHILLNKSPVKATTPNQSLQIPKIKILQFGSQSPKERNNASILLDVVKSARPKESKTPDRVLDAPGVLEDQGPQLLDWSTNNMLALALEDAVYLWDASTHQTTLLCRSFPYTWITAVKWSSDESVLAVASSDGRLNCWYQESGGVVVLKRATRITCLAWNSTDLTCGHVDGQIRHIDTSTVVENAMYRFNGHAFPVSSLSWSRQGALLASGCEGGECKIWNGKDSKSMHILERCSTQIRALQWCPWFNSILAVCTEGNIIVWKISSLPVLMSKTVTDSTITDFKWLPVNKGAFSSHANGDINLWRFPSMTNTQRFKGEGSGTLSLALSPGCSSLMSLGADEVLRLWTSFQTEEKRDTSKSQMQKICVR